MSTSLSPALLLLLAAFILKAASTSCAQDGGPDKQTYNVRGTLKSFDAAKHEASIAHDEIPGFMSAMTMSFDVPDMSAFQTLHTGDRLVFRLCVEGERAWIDHVRGTGTRVLLAVTPPKPGVAAELKAGDDAPGIEWTDQDGKKIRMLALRGSALAVTFVYSRCPLPTYCPLMNRNFSKVQTLLKQLGAQENWHMISMSMDAANDTPAVLAEHAKSHLADKKHWSFASADEPQLRRLGDALGLEFQRNGTQINHNLRTVVIDVNGRIARIFHGNSWTPQDLAAELRKAMKPSH